MCFGRGRAGGGRRPAYHEAGALAFLAGLDPEFAAQGARRRASDRKAEAGAGDAPGLLGAPVRLKNRFAFFRRNSGAVVAHGDDVVAAVAAQVQLDVRSEEHTSELQSLMRISYAVFCLK